MNQSGTSTPNGTDQAAVTPEGAPHTKPKIDFFLIGAAKCGTTSMYRTFSRHPEIYVPPIKEPRFMSGENWKKGWKWYAANWKRQPPGTITGDFSPSYSVSLGSNARAPRMIAEHYPKAKIIYIVRDPVAAAISNWRMAVFANRKKVGFLDAVRHFAAVGERIRYWSQISQYRKYFPDDQIRVIVVEEITRNRARLSELFRWLGVRSEGPGVPRFATANKSKARTNKPPKLFIPLEDRAIFIEEFRDEALNILKYAGVKTSAWPLKKSSKVWLSDEELAELDRKREHSQSIITMFTPPFARNLAHRIAAKQPGQRLKRLVFVRIPRKITKLFRRRPVPHIAPKN